MNALKSILKGVKFTRNTISEESKKTPSKLKKSLLNPFFIMNTVTLLAMTGAIGTQAYQNHQEKSLLNGTYSVSYENFQTEDRYIFSVDEMISDLTLNNKNITLIDYDIEDESTPMASHNPLIDTECTIYMNNSENSDILHELTNTNLGFYNQEYDFNFDPELKKLMESFILTHEAVHCAEHTAKGFFDSFFSYLDTHEEIEADSLALQYIGNVLDTSTEQGFEQYSKLAKTITTGRMLNEIQNLTYLVLMDTNLRQIAVNSSHNQEIRDMIEKLESSHIEVSQLEDNQVNKKLFAMAGQDKESSKLFFENENTFTHFTSMSLINESGSFRGFSFTPSEHTSAFEKLHSIMVENEGVANLWTEVGNKHWWEQVDKIERILLSMIAIAADKDTPNDVRKLISNYVAITNTLNFSLPENIEIQRSGSIEGNTIIRLTSDGKLHSLNSKFPAMIVIDKNGDILNTMSAHNGFVHKIDNYTSESAMNSISHHEDFFIFQYTSFEDAEEQYDAEYYSANASLLK